MSADGKFLVFTSDATDLVGTANGSNQSSDVFVRNLVTGTTTLVSVTPSGQTGNGRSFSPEISPDGRYVAFLSQATNLTAVPSSTTNGTTTNNAFSLMGGLLYVRDLQTQTTTLLDLTAAGQISNGWCTGTFVFSPDSTKLAFIDNSTNLTSATADQTPTSPPWINLTGAAIRPSYVYVRNLAQQTTELASVSTTGQASGTDLSGPASDLVFSPNSQLLAFDSTATDLTSNPPASSPAGGPFFFPIGNTNLFLRDLSAHTTTLVSATADGRYSNGSSISPVFSPNGRYLAFDSNATGLTSNAQDLAPAPYGLPTYPGQPGSAFENLYVRDLNAGTNRLVTTTPGGKASNGLAGPAVFSPDSKLLAYTSSATDLTANAQDTAPPPFPVPPPVGILGPGGVPSFPTPVPAIAFAVTYTNLFVQDLTAKTNTAVTLTPDGKLSNGNASAIAFSPDGQELAFTTTATDLTSNPLDTTVPPGITPVPTTGPLTGFNGGLMQPAPGQQLAPALVPIPFFAQPGNVFVRNLATQSTAAASLTPDGKLSTSIQSPSNLIFSLDGRFLFFTSGATDLTGNPPDTAGGLPPAGFSTFNNVFVHDSVTGTTALVTPTTEGKVSSSSFINALLSPDQHTLYFDSTASNLTPGGPTVGSNLFAATAPFTSDGQVQFASWQTTAKESDGQALVTVVRSAPLGQPATVNYTVQDGTAKGGLDFKPTSGTLSFAAGEATQTISVPLIAAAPFDGVRTATIALSNPAGVSLGYPSTTLYLFANVPVPPPPVPIPPTPIVVPPTPVQNPPTPVNLPPVPVQTPPVTMPVTPTPTPILPYSTMPPSNAGPGPTIVGLNATVGKRGVITMVVGFSRAMDPASAGNAANYAVNLQGHNVKVRHGHVVSTVFRPGRTIPITSLVYDPATYETTLTLGSGLGRNKLFQFRASGSTGGLVDTSGRPLNSPHTGYPGQDDIVMVGWPKPARGATATTNGY